MDSLRIVFNQGGQIWLWQHGKAQPLTRAGEEDLPLNSALKISTDGTLIAFAREGGIWTIQSDGTRERLLASSDLFKTLPPQDPGVELAAMDWISGTHRLLFSTHLRNTSCPNIAFTGDLHWVDADTQEYRQFLAPKEGGSFKIAPDGKKVAVAALDKVILMDIERASRQVLLTFAPILPGYECGIYPQVAWAADSQSLRVAIPPPLDISTQAHPTTLWNLPVDGTAPTPIASVHANSKSTSGPVYISPDLKRLAYFQIVPGQTTLYELHLARADGSHDKIVYSEPPAADFGGWTPDSNHYTLFKSGPNYGLLYGDSDGNFIPFPPEIYAADWIDEQYFLLISGFSGHRVLNLGSLGKALLPVSGIEKNTLYYDFIH